jgi:dihydroorotate dehydrogenase (fumarate)
MDVLPLMNAAGIVKTEADASRFLKLPLPALVMGSYTLEERAGNPGTSFFSQPRLGSVNALGLPGPGINEWTDTVAAVSQRASNNSKELWVSVAGFSASEFGLLADAALVAGADRVELNLGCPNAIEDGKRKAIASYSPQAVHDAVAAADRAMEGRPNALLGVKLSPILDAGLLEEVCAVLDQFSSISFVTAINTVPNCLALNGDRSAINVLDGLGGMGGEAVKWIALGQLQQLGSMLRSDIDLIAVGGVITGQDVVDYLSLARVNRCQVGTAVWRSGPEALVRIGQEYAETFG